MLLHVVPPPQFFLSLSLNPLHSRCLLLPELSSQPHYLQPPLRFQAAFRTVVPPSCQQQHSHNHSPGPSVQRNIFLTECHLVELTEDAGSQFPLSAVYPQLAPSHSPLYWTGTQKGTLKELTCPCVVLYSGGGKGDVAIYAFL